MPTESRSRLTFAPAPALAEAEEETEPIQDETEDDRADLRRGDRVLLSLENARAFARMLLDVAHARGYKGLITGYAAAALSLAAQYLPHAITIDISLPDINGWRVLEKLKNSAATRHIPVYVITTDEDRERALRSGAIGVAVKPIQTRETLDQVLGTLLRYAEKQERELLLVEPDPERARKLRAFIPESGVKVVEARSTEEALDRLNGGTTGCVVLKPAFDKGDAEGLISSLVANGRIQDVPVLVYAPEGKAQGDAAPPRLPSQNPIERQ